jgi:hypothetical protein
MTARDNTRRGPDGAPAYEPKGPKPYHQATPQKGSAVAPQPIEPTSPRRLRLTDLKQALEERGPGNLRVIPR